jgi:hypothetical protein
VNNPCGASLPDTAPEKILPIVTFHPK